MQKTREKRLRLPGVELRASVDEQLRLRVTSSRIWRYLLRPLVQLIRRQGNRQEQQVIAASAPEDVTRPADLDQQGLELWSRVTALAWYHTMDLGHGVVSPGTVDTRAEVGRSGLPLRLDGMRCLDVGTFDGFWAFEMEKRGAGSVVALDVDSLEEMDLPRRTKAELIAEARSVRGSVGTGNAFRLAHEVLGSRVERRLINIYDLSPDETGMFDLVFVSDVMVHLRDPIRALESIYSVTGGSAIVFSAFDPDLDAHRRPLNEFLGAEHYWVWWNFSAQALKKMMITAGFGPVTELSRFTAENRAGRFWKVVLRGEAPR